jgi:hypothetical protein
MLGQRWAGALALSRLVNTGPRGTHGGNHCLRMPVISRTSTTRASKLHTGGTIACLASPGLQQHGLSSDIRGEPLPAWHLRTSTTQAIERHTEGTIVCLASPGLQQHWLSSDALGESLPAWHLQHGPQATHGGNHSLPGISRTSTTLAHKAQATHGGNHSLPGISRTSTTRVIELHTMC